MLSNQRTKAQKIIAAWRQFVRLQSYAESSLKRDVKEKDREVFATGAYVVKGRLHVKQALLTDARRNLAALQRSDDQIKAQFCFSFPLITRLTRDGDKDILEVLPLFVVPVDPNDPALCDKSGLDLSQKEIQPVAANLERLLGFDEADIEGLPVRQGLARFLWETFHHKLDERYKLYRKIKHRVDWMEDSRVTVA